MLSVAKHLYHQWSDPYDQAVSFYPLLLLPSVLFALLGCESVATEQPVVSPTLETSTPLPPTAPFTPAVSPTPVPTADFTPADIIGTWTRDDPERGTLFLIFLETGTYKAAHGSPDVVIQSGRYTLEGRVFTFIDGWDCGSAGDVAGQYILKLGGEGKFLFFETLKDTCPDRPRGLKSIRWDRLVISP